MLGNARTFGHQKVHSSGLSVDNFINNYSKLILRFYLYDIRIHLSLW